MEKKQRHMIPNAEILQLEQRLWLVVRQIGLPTYDFNFRDWFQARSASELPQGVKAVARVGAIPDYADFYDECKKVGVSLINSPEEHLRASQLDCWYPMLSDLTPKSVCFKGRPTLEEIKAQFDWPVFMKGARQTSRHQRKLSIIENDNDFLEAMKCYADDPILGWQDVVCREFVPLRRLNDDEASAGEMPRRFEFRTFWWKGQLAGAGHYWWEGPPYKWTSNEQAAGLAVAREAARRVDVPFLVVDIAQMEAGRWIVIECNDGQESGYAGVSPLGLWRNIIDLEAGLTH
jgi:hypothetical protein